VKNVADSPSQPYGHDRKTCTVFRSVKQGLNPRSYCSTSLARSEEIGFAAAGVIFVTRRRGKEPEFLLAREMKTSDDIGMQDQLNFLGGKRVLHPQTALDVAVQKARKETGMLLHQDAAQLKACALPLVYWDGTNKYAYFFIELDRESDVDIDWRCAGVEGSHRLEWVRKAQLLDAAWVRDEVHGYAGSTILGLVQSGVLQRLEEIFDVVLRAATAAPAPKDDEADVVVKFDFDVVSAILNASTLRDGVARLPSAVSEALRTLPTPDLHKLKLRFHPDKLRKQLGSRAPTDEEIALSTATFQLFQNIGDRQQTAQLAGQISELNGKIDKYRRSAKEDTGEARDYITDVADLLNKIKLDAGRRR